MRFAPLLALGAAVVAQDASVDDDDSGPIAAASALAAASAAASASNEASLPQFTPTTLKDAPFLEQFTDGLGSRWKASHAKKENTDEEWQFVGTWEVEEPTVFKGIAGDKGLVLKDKAAHHAISAKFDKPIDNKGKTLVVQYEVKLQNFLECGGAYMKLLKEDAALSSDEFSNASPYIIMFGPDKCGATNKVHFIFRHKNPVSGEYEEKHLGSPPMAEINKLSNLYTLVVKPDQTFEILINDKSSVNGSLLEDFKPAVNPEKEIDDPEDKKPEDWVDEKQIQDPDATKPEDWDEDAPYEIVDAEATKPEDWLDNEPTSVPDPEASVPEDWDEEEDGTWEPPVIPNPKCSEASGCGLWEAPMIKNPAYKGRWNAPFIDNPAYKGEWAPRKISNPTWFEDKLPANFEPMGAIGFELWTMNADILFDNIYIGHSIEEAATLRKETWDIKRPSEDQAQAAQQDTPDDSKRSPDDLVFMDDPVFFIKEKTALFIELVQKNPIDAIKFVPEVAAAIGLGIVTILVVLFGAGAAAAPSADEIKAKAQKAKDAAQKTKDQAADAVTTGAEKAKDEATKRTTRSSGQ